MRDQPDRVAIGAGLDRDDVRDARRQAEVGAPCVSFLDADVVTVEPQLVDDVLAGFGVFGRADRPAPVLVGFAAETSDVIGYASRKREGKRVDLIVANDVGQPGAGFEVETNIASFVTADGVESFPIEAKTALAARIVAFIARRLAPAPQVQPTAK